jgi:creatinine amidohydrolase
MTRSVMWKELTAEDLRAKAAADAIVILPVASMEQHGPHLPVGVDTILCEAVCKAGAEATAADVPVVVAPTLWCGMAEHHMAFGGTFTFDIPTYRAVLLCLLRSLSRHGFKRVIIVNGHGGNKTALNAFLPDFAVETGLAVRAVTYPDVAPAAMKEVLEDQEGMRHACEAETSLMLVAAPDTVKRDRLPEAFGPPFSHAASGLPAVQRFASFKEFSASGVIGDARRASEAKGERLLAAFAAGLAKAIEDPQTWGLRSNG